MEAEQAELKGIVDKNLSADQREQYMLDTLQEAAEVKAEQDRVAEEKRIQEEADAAALAAEKAMAEMIAAEDLAHDLVTQPCGNHTYICSFGFGSMHPLVISEDAKNTFDC